MDDRLGGRRRMVEEPIRDPQQILTLLPVQWHAGPDAGAQVTLTFGEQHVAVEVTDHGGGTPSAGADEGGGLRGMRERAAVYDGTVASGPLPDGDGWRTATTLTFAGAPSPTPTTTA